MRFAIIPLTTVALLTGAATTAMADGMPDTNGIGSRWASAPSAAS